MDCSINVRALAARSGTDGIEVGYVPALLEHVDVNHDLGRLVHALQASRRVIISSSSAPVRLESTWITLPR